MSREIAARRPGAAVSCVFRSREIVPRHEISAAFSPAVADLLQALSAGAGTRPAQFSEAGLISVPATMPIEDAVVRVLPVSRQRLADLEAWMDSHLEEPITVGRLYEVAGVSNRSLQLAFELHRGTSPIRFVVERRMAAAHRRSSAADRAWDVTSIATRNDFLHLGRFAVAYRLAFGESPSQTLRASVRQAQREKC